MPRKKKTETPAAPKRRRAVNEHRELKKKISQRIGILTQSIEELESRGLAADGALEQWKEHLLQVSSSLEDPLLRIAVVGTVKSGKSTLINALLGRDILKRGAGIITAFITRLVTAGETGGWVEFKPWPQILDELNATVRMLPHGCELATEDHGLDLRVAEDRERLRELLVKIQEEWCRTDGRLDPGHLILRGYLEGYDRVCQYVGETTNRLYFDEHSLEQHQQYVGSEGQAVYLRDMELHHPVDWLGENIELADCQGIDSPNPLHFALLQQHLLKSHFILYVISSRSGLREADFRLLDFIRTLKMFPQTFFVLNVDLDDHPHQEDLERLSERVRSELSWLVGTPRFFLFSALYHLVVQLKDAASGRERRHLRLWREESLLVKMSDTGFREFRDILSREIGGERVRVLCGSGLSRLGRIAASVMNTAAMGKKLLAPNAGDVQQIATVLKAREEKLLGSLTTLKNAISGLQISLREDIDRTVGPYFDTARGRMIQETLEAVPVHPVRPAQDETSADYRWFFHRFHQVYCEFRHSLACYLVEKVNVQMIEFAKKAEESLGERFRHAAEAFWVLFETAVDDYRRETGILAAAGNAGEDWSVKGWEIEEPTAPPNFSAFLENGAIGRGMLLMKLGVASVTRFLGDFSARIGRPRDLLLGTKRYETMIQEASKLLRKEASRELLQAFRDYETRLKTDFLYRLVDGETERLLQEFEMRTQMVQVKVKDLLDRKQTEGDGRESLVETLTRTQQIGRAMIEELEELRTTLR